MSRYVADPRRTVSPESALASDIFDKFCSANTLKGILSQYRQLCCVLRIKPTHFPDFYPRLKAKLSSWRAQGLWSKFEKRATQKCYGRGKSCYGTRVLIIGAGPCGLRSAIEAQLLGAKVVLVEKRDRFSRNNVLHLWPFVIADLKALGAKKFYGKFCAGSIDHISIRQLQCILLKVALLLGVEVHEGVGFEGLREPSDNEGWRAVISPADHPVSHYNFDVLIGADGRRNTLDGFKRKALRAKLAIAITANFINKHTEAEARVKEISGVSYIFNQKFFQDLCEATGIDLENIVYYKDETHYFVMTAKKQSLLNKGVLLQDFADTAKLLSHENISSDALMEYAWEAAMFATEYQLPDIEFAVNHYGQPDVAMFDFTAMYAAENACRVAQKKGHKLLMTLVGDSLLEPFWPTGSGCARGFLSSFDAGWMLRSWSSGVKSVLEVIAERESIYRLLGQTTPENLQKEHTAYSIDPHTRYPNLNSRLVVPFQVKSLYESDEKILDVPESATDVPAVDNDKIPKKRRRDSVIAVDSLISWLRDQVSCYNLEINDIRDAFVRGDVLCAIVHRFRPDLIEYPLPSEENVDPLIAAAFMNQLAFDIMHQEYGLSHAMSGYESVQFVSSDFLSLVAYLSQVYEIFRGEIPQTKYLRSESGDEVEENYHQPNLSQALKQLRMKVTAKHHFTQKSTGRKSRLSSSKDSRDGDSEPHRRHRKRRSDEKHRAGSSSEICNSEPLSVPKLTKEGRKIQDRVFDAQRFMKSMQLLQLSQGHEPVHEDDDDNDGFHDVSFYLYRQTVPDFDERCKSLEEKLVGRGMKMSFGKSLRDSQGSQDSEKMVPGLAKDLEAKLKGRTVDRQKPKDLIRAIGKIEKSDWNVQLIEKKMAEVKNSGASKKDKDNKVPRWSREAYDDKRDAMKRKMDGAGSGGECNASIQKFEETVKTLGNKLKEGNTLDIGQRGSNKVSAMAEQLRHKFVTKTVPESVEVELKQPVRPTFEMPKKGRIDLCHFCKERVYVVERMTAEGKYFHRNCFRCEYCNTSLRIGNYVFDREGRYGERFYCAAHYTTVRMYGWKKFDTTRPEEKSEEKYGRENSLVPPASQQILSEMDERGTTPERAEFENSVDFASEEEILNEIDEDEWTDRNNFGTSNADNTSDEASDLSDDEEVTPDGNKVEDNVSVPCKVVASDPEGANQVKKDVESSDSDTEVASDDEDEEDGSGEDCSYEEDPQEEDEEEEDDEDDEYEEEECGGSTTEIETDSEFAEDPPHSVPGSIPTIIVNAPEQLVTRLVDATPLNHTQKSQPSREPRTADKQRHYNDYNQRKFADLYYDDKSVELVKKGGPERQLPVVTSVPKKWEPLVFNNPDRLASIELKKKYLHGTVAPMLGNNQKKPADAAATTQFKSLLDMISEQQKLLQPASQPSASMQAFLDGTEKLKNKTNLPYLNRNLSTFQTNNVNSPGITPEKPATVLIENSIPVVPKDERHPNNNGDCFREANVIEIQSNDVNSLEDMNSYEKDSLEPDIVHTEEKGEQELNTSNNVKDGEKAEIEFSVTITATTDEEAEKEEYNVMIASNDSFSASQSETETRSTVINVLGSNVNESSDNVSEEEADSGSDTEVGSGEPLSDLDDLDFEHNPPQVIRDPPRVEIEDEFGVTQSLDVSSENKKIKNDSKNTDSEQESKYIMDLGLSESIGKSSSESSLNSGIFLETEISEYIKDEQSVADQNKLKMKIKKGNKQGQSNRKSRSKKIAVTESPDKTSKGKPNLGFDLEALDFADIDGLSSPEDGEFDPVRNIPTISATPQSEVQIFPSTTVAENIQDSRRTSTATESPCEDDEEISSSSTKERRGNSASEADISEDMNFSSEENVQEIKITPGLVDNKQKESFPHLERVGPFSSARDSLDYRKTKAVTSHLKNKELYSTYAVPSVKVGTCARSTVWEEESHRLEDIGETTSIDSSIINTMSDDSNKLTGSPGTTRKLNEIHQERVKQNDLIRSMVLGRIKRSPDKGIRRNSKGSLSGTSLQSQTTQDKSGDESDSRKSSDNSQGHEGNTSEDGSIEPIAAEVRKERSTSEESSGNDNIPHRPMAESVSSNSDNSTTSRSARILLSPQKVQPNYEPVFTSSPRFRNRPKFDGLPKTYQSITEPPTPTEANHQPIYLNSEALINDEKSKGIYSVANPLFFRSMPNLAQPIESFKGSVKDYLISSDSRVANKPDVDSEIRPENDPPRINQAVFETNKAPPVSQGYNPFLVKPPASTSSSSEPQEDYTVSKDPIVDDFIDLHLKFRTNDRPSERKLSPEKSRSVCTGSLNNYNDSGFYQGSISAATSSHPRSSVRYTAGDNWILEKQENLGRPRSNTLTELNFKETQPVQRPQRASVSFVDDRSNPFLGQGQNSRHQNEYADSGQKHSKSKALSSDTLLDGSPLSENACRGTSVPDIPSDTNREPAKERKGKDRDRRRSLIQAVSDFFTRPTNSFDKSPSSGGQSLTTSASSSSIVSPTKEKFSLFKLTPKLLQTKDKKTSKSRECVVSPASNQPSSSNKYRMDSFGDSTSKSKTDFSAYFVQPSVIIQRLSSSPIPPKPERTFSSLNEKRASAPDFNSCTQNMATLSIVANSNKEKEAADKHMNDYQRLETLRSREIDEIQLQLESIEADQRVLESRGAVLERRLKEPDETYDNEVMEEWLAVNREQTRLARFEKELLVRAQELELEARKRQLEGQLDKALSIRESDKTPQEKQREIDILHELRRVNEQHGNLLNSIHADMEKYKSEDSNNPSDFGLTPPGSSRLESDV